MAIYLGQWLSGYSAVLIASAVGGKCGQLLSSVGIICNILTVLSTVFIAVTQKNESAKIAHVVIGRKYFGE